MPGPGKRTPLHNAADGGHALIIEDLINAGASIHVKDAYGDTPIHIAAGKGHSVVVNLLLKKGASVDAKNKEGIYTASCSSLLRTSTSRSIPYQCRG